MKTLSITYEILDDKGNVAEETVIEHSGYPVQVVGYPRGKSSFIVFATGAEIDLGPDCLGTDLFDAFRRSDKARMIVRIQGVG